MPLRSLQTLERKIERQLRFIELKKGAIERRIDWRLRDFEQKNLNRFDDEFRFLRTWLEKPLSVGAVAPSGKALARIMAGYVDPAADGPDRRARPRHRPGHRGVGGARHRSCAPGAGRIRSGILRALAQALSRRHRGAGRRLQSAPDAGRRAAHAGGRVRVGPAAVQQAAQDAARPARPGLRPDAAGRAVRAVHLQRDLADPALARRASAREAPARVWRNFPPARVWVYRQS